MNNIKKKKLKMLKNMILLLQEEYRKLNFFENQEKEIQKVKVLNKKRGNRIYKVV